MENLYTPSTSDTSPQKVVRDAQRLAADARDDLDDAVRRGKDAARDVAEDVKGAGRAGKERVRELADAARRNLDRAAGRVSAYADENTALVAVAAFGVGLLVGHLVSRES